MLVFHDFKCTNGHVFEEFTQREQKISRCQCGADAKRVIATPHFHLNGSDGTFPTAASKWERERERRGGRTGDS